MPLQHNDQEEDDLTFKEALTFFKNSSSDYIAARRELLEIEAKEAGFLLRKKLTFLILLAVFGFVGYLLLWVLIIGLGATLLDGQLGAISEAGAEWLILVAVGLALHTVAAMVLISKLKQKSEYPLFEMTKAEFKKDKEWLEENN